MNEFDCEADAVMALCESRKWILATSQRVGPREMGVWRMALTLICLAPSAASATPPSSYAECLAAAKYSTHTGFRCSYEVPENTSIDQSSADYVECEVAKPENRSFANFECRFEVNGGSRPYIHCTPRGGVFEQGRPRGGPISWFGGPCVAKFYNVGFAFPRSFAECLSSDDHTIGGTYDGREICSLSFDGKDAHDGQELAQVLQRCESAGGRVVRDAKSDSYSHCDLSFVQPWNLVSIDNRKRLGLLKLYQFKEGGAEPERFDSEMKELELSEHDIGESPESIAAIKREWPQRRRAWAISYAKNFLSLLALNSPGEDPRKIDDWMHRFGLTPTDIGESEASIAEIKQRWFSLHPGQK